MSKSPRAHPSSPANQKESRPEFPASALPDTLPRSDQRIVGTRPALSSLLFELPSRGKQTLDKSVPKRRAASRAPIRESPQSVSDAAASALENSFVIRSGSRPLLRARQMHLQRLNDRLRRRIRGPRNPLNSRRRQSRRRRLSNSNHHRSPLQFLQPLAPRQLAKIMHRARAVKQNSIHAAVKTVLHFSSVRRARRQIPVS